MKTLQINTPSHITYGTGVENFTTRAGEIMLLNGLVFFASFGSNHGAQIIARFDTNGAAARTLLEAGWNYCPIAFGGVHGKIKMVKFFQ